MKSLPEIYAEGRPWRESLRRTPSGRVHLHMLEAIEHVPAAKPGYRDPLPSIWDQLLKEAVETELDREANRRAVWERRITGAVIAIALLVAARFGGLF